MIRLSFYSALGDVHPCRVFHIDDERGAEGVANFLWNKSREALGVIHFQDAHLRQEVVIPNSWLFQHWLTLEEVEG